MGRGGGQFASAAAKLASPRGSARRLLAAIEARLEDERDRIGLWLPVAVGAGIAAYFALDAPAGWAAAGAGFALIAAAGAMLGAGPRLGRMLLTGGLAALAGLGWMAWRAEAVAAPVLARPLVTDVVGKVLARQDQPARGQVRLVIAPVGRADLPRRLRVTMAGGAPPVQPGDHLAARMRLSPPGGPMFPGGYDFARTAWFEQIGAVGSVLGSPVVRPGRGANGAAAGLASQRARLSAHVQAQVGGGAGGIAATLVTGDRGGIADADADAMRTSGLAHLLSISGLHVTAVVGAVMLVVLRLLALSPRLALRANIVVIAAASGAAAALGYTLLTGAAVPTVRACIAALLVLTALALGRAALTLRLVAAGALAVMLLWPWAVASPSFQMSFAAVAVLVAVHDHPRLGGWLAGRGETGWRRVRHGLAGLLITGLAIEAVLAPIALYHFQKAGLYGALANLVAIPLTTFVIMPLTGLALVLDGLIGGGGPAWWLVRQSLDLMLGVAHGVAAWPGAATTLPKAGTAGFAAAVLGGVWLIIWQGPMRHGGTGVMLAGAASMALAAPPDLIVSGDGRHVAARMADDSVAVLRPGTGGYAADQIRSATGLGGALPAIADQPGARCNADYCRWTIQKGQREWHILAARNDAMADLPQLLAACAAADIVIAPRYLPSGCRPRWLIADRNLLGRTGGISIDLGRQHGTVARPATSRHPWHRPQLVSGNDEADPQAGPEP